MFSLIMGGIQFFLLTLCIFLLLPLHISRGLRKCVCVNGDRCTGEKQTKITDIILYYSPEFFTRKFSYLKFSCFNLPEDEFFYN